MAKLALNKSTLSHEKKRKSSYLRYLPSLELKQKQLMAERKKAQQEWQQHNKEIEALESLVAQQLPMLAVKDIDMQNLVTIHEVIVEEENLLGLQLPVLKEVTCKKAEYGYLARPHWFDEAARMLEKMVRLKLEERVLENRLQLLHKAVRTITQRVNLFSKVLIPETKQNIKRIGLFLADQERAGIVRSKLAKQKGKAV